MGNDIDFSKKFAITIPPKQDPSLPVIVVDDQVDIRLIITHHLTKLSFSKILQAGDGYEAITLLQSTPNCAMVLCDFQMPMLGAIELLNEMKDRVDIPRVPFCLMLEGASRERLMHAIEHGVDEILAKPFTLQDLTAKITSCFRNFHNPRNPEKVYELAKINFRARRFDDATVIYQALRDASPKAVRPLLGMARVAIATGKLEEASKLLLDAEVINPKFVATWNMKAELQLMNKDMAGAVESYKSAIFLSPLNPVRYKTAADMLFKMQRYPEAVEILELAYKNQVQFKELNHYLSQACFMVRDYQRALKFIKTAVLAEPENIAYLNQYGICLKETSQFEEAAKVYNQIIKKEPENKSALYNKAILLFARGEKEESIKLLERIVKKHPDFAQAAAKLKEYQQTLNVAQKPA
jgi:two-component system chemotaxis response regulator CheY